MSIEELITLKRRYTEMKTNLQSIVTYLNNCIKNLNTPSNNISNLYNIDSISIDNGNLYKIMEDLMTKKNYISSTIIPDINIKLNEIQTEIESAG